MTDAETSPTQVRHQVIGICALMSVLLYLDRFCVSFAETYIREDLRLSEVAISLMFSAFFLTYALGQPMSGWLADRFGGRAMLTLYIFSWSLITALTGFANGVVMLVLLRLGFGLSQAGAYPTAANLISRWVPLTRRGKASSMVALGGRVGGVLALFVTGYVIMYFTPINVPSTLSETDILRMDRLSYELVYGNRSPKDTTSGDGGMAGKVGARILDTFPSALRQQVIDEADQTRAREATQSKSPPPASNVDHAEVATALNDVIRAPDFFRQDELTDVKLEYEAQQLLDKRESSQLASAEVERMNRLILEAIYPHAIKKVYCAGWRKMLWLYGSLGIPVTILFWFICRDDPSKHPRCNEAELALINQGRERMASENVEVTGLPLRHLMSSWSMWCNGAMQFFTNVGWVFFMTYAPRYFLEVHSAPVSQRTWMTATPAVVACFGMFLGGMITDPAVGWLGRRWGRSVPIALTRFGAAGAYLLCLLNPSPWTAVAVLALASMLCDLGIPAVWAFQQDVGGKYAGSVLGWGNMWGNLGAVVGPTLIGTLVGATQNWNMVFIACAAAFMLSGLIALGIDATRPLAPQRATSSS